MAIYHVGHRSLTETEFEAEVARLWAVKVFVGIALLVGLAVWRWLLDSGWPHWVRFACLAILPTMCAYQAARYTRVIRALFYVGSALTALGSLASALWWLL